MKFSNFELPSNKKFGFFFAIVFLAAAAYFFIEKFYTATYILITLSSIFFLVALIKAEVLLPLNKFWMFVGLLLGLITSPIVLGFMFFVIITPYGLVMRAFGRDSLLLKVDKNNSHWIVREERKPQTNFNQQF